MEVTAEQPALHHQFDDPIYRRPYRASPTRLLTYLDCPRRYRFAYLDRPTPAKTPPRAHTVVGVVVHNVLRDFWDLAPGQRTPDAVARSLAATWSDVGFRDAAQSATWRSRITAEVVDYLRGIDRDVQPRGVERSVNLPVGRALLMGRIDRIDDRDGELVIVDYKTSRRPIDGSAARVSLPLAFYAAAVGRLFRSRCVTVELHHVPTGEVIAHQHTDESLDRKLAEADSIVAELIDVDQSYAQQAAASTAFPPRPSALCRWCDFREHCPEGQAMGPAMLPWEGLEPTSA